MPTPRKIRPIATTHQPLPHQSGRSAFAKAFEDLSQPNPAFPNVSARWLISTVLLVIAAALAFAWLTLCLLYWQGSWQLLYHPSPTISRTPASVGLHFESIAFAATETGQTQLTGWWIPGASAHTVLYLHGAAGNLSDTLDSLAALHHQDLAIFAIDYRNYGRSQSSPNVPHPSEKQFRQDAEWALTYLTLTRHIDPKQIVIYGANLGANLAAELAADHGELAGVVLDQPQTDPLATIFHDPRSRFVPAHTLLSDRYDLTKAAQSLSIPSLWLITQEKDDSVSAAPKAYKTVVMSKSMVYLYAPIETDPNYHAELSRWLGDL